MSRIEVVRSFGRTDGPTKAACSTRSKVKRKGKRWIHGRKDTQTQIFRCYRRWRLSKMVRVLYYSSKKSRDFLKTAITKREGWWWRKRMAWRGGIVSEESYRFFFFFSRKKKEERKYYERKKEELCYARSLCLSFVCFVCFLSVLSSTDVIDVI